MLEKSGTFWSRKKNFPYFDTILRFSTRINESNKHLPIDIALLGPSMRSKIDFYWIFIRIEFTGPFLHHIQYLLSRFDISLMRTKKFLFIERCNSNID